MKSWLRSLSFFPALLVVVPLAMAQTPSADAQKENAEKAPASPSATPAMDAPPAAPEPDPELRRLDRADVSPADEIRARAEAIRQRADEMRQRARERVEAERARMREHAMARIGKNVVNVFHDSHLEAGARADNVVAVFGSSHSEGEVSENVVSIFGETRTGGAVGENVVTVFGNTDVSNRVGENVVTVFGNVTINQQAETVVAVFGDVKLGPQAAVDHVICVMGQIERDPSAVVRHGANNFGRNFGLGSGIGVWISQCFFKARPLAFNSSVLWAWCVAFSFLAIYLFIAAVFRGTVEKCLVTLDTQPGATALATVAMPIFKVVVFPLLCITVVGILVVPFLAGGLFIAGLFGNAVMLAWLGRKLLKVAGNGIAPPVLAVLVGGLLVLALYTVPVLGLFTYKLLGWVGLGAVVSTLLSSRSEKVNASVTFPVAAVPGGVAGFSTASAFTVNPPAMGATPFTTPASDPASAAGMAVPASAPRPIVSAVTLPRAGFWIRFGALFLDLLMLWVGVLIVTRHVDLMPFCIAAYAAIMWRLKATTIGGVICGLKVVRLDGREIDWTTAIVRTLGCFLSLIAAGLGFIWVAVDEGKQSWHDKIAGTTVVRVPKGIALI